MQFQSVQYAYDNLQLLNSLLDYKMNSEEFMKNEKVIETVSKVVDNLKGKDQGYILFSIAYGLQRKIILVTKSSNRYFIYQWNTRDSIEKPFEAIILDENFSIDLIVYALEIAEESSLSMDECIEYMLVDSLTGYKLNKDRPKELVEFMKVDGNIDSYSNEVCAEHKELSELLTIARLQTHEMKKQKEETKNNIIRFGDRLKCDDLKIRMNTQNIHINEILVGKIEKVKELGNKRIFKINYTQYKRNSKIQNYGIVVGSALAEGRGRDLTIYNYINCKCYLANTQNYGGRETDYDVSDLKRIPYNYIDEGRLLIGLRTSNYEFRLIISPDPRVESDFKQIFKEETSQITDKLIKENLCLDETTVGDETTGITYYKHIESIIKRESSTTKETETIELVSPLQLKLKTIKRMVDEHNYLVKKKSAEGSDVFITDKIKYNHSKGRIAYNDFSIEINDELVKSKLYKHFDGYLVSYYRGSISEQEILDGLLDTVFSTLEERLMAAHKEDYKINIIINDSINLEVEGKLTKNRSLLLYLNTQRFNKNELLSVVREITCYRSQEEANRFITNIGKIGLSVYIGISTGYEIEYPKKERDDEHEIPVKRIFKFRKLKGRSSYELILDSTHIPLSGKQLINILYQQFIGEHVVDFFKKIDKTIFESCESSLNYLKYKFLIDSSYEAFKNKAKEFLDKKVNDTDSKYVLYYNKKSKKNMEAIKVNGMSGSTYIIAYDSKNSFVFMDPSLSKTKATEELYEEGKYICMIDQSNIKSNIGYDTVVSKLMALRNDSSIAHTIYNLEEEIG
jgi:hypothetical protein